jgi:hypothetical protein
MLKKYLLILFLFVVFASYADENTEKVRSWTLNGYVKFLQTISFQKVNENWLTDNLVHNRLNFNWNISSNLTFNTQMRNRIFYGETVTDFPLYSTLVTGDNGFVDLSWNLFETKSVFMNVSFDKVYLNYDFWKFQVTVGRQRINWGQTFVWNPNDIFNTYSFFDFDYEEKPGSDAVRVQFYPNYSSTTELAINIDSAENLTAAALYKFNKWSYDLQFLGGWYKSSDIVLGAGFSGNLLKGGLSGEVTWFHPVDNFSDTSGTFVASLGYNYTFANSLMLEVEGLYNGYGSSNNNFDLKKYYFLQISAQKLSLTRFSFFGQVSYQITPLFKGTFSVVYNPNDNSWYIGPSLVYSLMENLEISGYAQYFTSPMPASKGGRGTFLYWRLKWSF